LHRLVSKIKKNPTITASATAIKEDAKNPKGHVKCFDGPSGLTFPNCTGIHLYPQKATINFLKQIEKKKI